MLEHLPAKATIPPLNLLTIAAMLPATWSKKLVDLNVEPLTDDHLSGVDMVFTGGMTIQSASIIEVVRRCHHAGVKICVGGPMASLDAESLHADHLFLGEVEETMPLFIEDLAQGHPKPMYQAERFPDLSLTPIPQWDLLTFSNYLTMPVQVSRGCPFDCDFCHVTILNGRKPRYKSADQVLKELTTLHQAGWRGPVFFVDDNIVGDKKRSKDFFEALVGWQRAHKYPFVFLSQASVNVADDPALLSLMEQCGFMQLFLGIETPSTTGLEECGKRQNLNRSLVDSVMAIQSHGIDVLGGFIIGFDSDLPTIFEQQEDFIETAAIPTAMVGLLAAPPGTRLYKRLQSEGRILGMSDGDSIMNLNGLNIQPAMGRETLIAGYKNLMLRLYEPGPYYRRVRNFFRHSQPNRHLPPRLPSRTELKSLLGILWGLGVKGTDRLSFWRFLGQVLLYHRPFFPLAVSMAVGGHHYRSMARKFMDSEACPANRDTVDADPRTC